MLNNPKESESRNWTLPDSLIVDALPRIKENFPFLDINSYREFLDYLFIEDWYEEAHRIHERLLAGEDSLDDSFIDQLRERSEKARDDEKVSREVSRARRGLRSFFLEKSRIYWLWQKKLYPLMYGSLQYDDPVNLDADIMLVSSSDSPKLAIEDEEKIRKMNEDLIDLWIRESFGKTKDAEPHIDTLIIDQIYNFIKHPSNGSYYGVFNACVGLTGEPIFKQDREKIESIRNNLREAIESSPLVCAINNETLKNCLRTREERAFYN